MARGVVEGWNLQLGGLGGTGAPSRDSVHAGAQGQTYQVRVEPKDPVVPFGEPLVVNCSLDCPGPGLVSLETALSKEPHSRGLGWAAFRLTTVTGDMEILCSGICNKSQVVGFSNITVFGE